MYLTEEYFKKWEQGFGGSIDQRFKSMDCRFEAIDRHFESIDRRFEVIDQRFEAIDRRFESIDQRFESMDHRFDNLEQEVAGIYPFIRELGENLLTRFNNDMRRYIGSLTEEYQSRMNIAAEGIAFIAEKCERTHSELKDEILKNKQMNCQNNQKLEKRILKLEVAQK